MAVVTRADQSRERLPLTVVDTTFVGVEPIDLIWTYSQMTDVERLESGFRAALARFNVFASVLDQDAEPVPALVFEPAAPRFSVGAPLEEYGCTDAEAPRLTEVLEHVRADPGRGSLGVRVVPVGSGCSLAVALRHVAGDAFSLLAFLGAWFQILHGRSQEPFYGHRRFVLSTERAREQAGFASIERETGPRAVSRAPASRVVDELRLSDRELADVVAAATGRTQEPGLHHALTAHLLKRYAPRIAGTAGRLRLRSPVDVRPLVPHLGDYMGNAFLDSVVPFSVDELGSLPQAETAARILESIGELRSKVASGDLVRLGAAGIEPGPLWDESYVPFDPTLDLVSSNVLRFSSTRFLGPKLEVGAPTWARLELPSGSSFMIRGGPGRDVVVQVRKAVAR